MSWIKILLLLLVLAVLSVVLIQNRELFQLSIALKILCSDASQACLYQTSERPLPIWIAIATLTGTIINLLVRALNRYGYSNVSRKKAILNDDLYPEDQGWKNQSGDRSKYNTAAKSQDLTKDKITDTKVYEANQEPQNVERSGSTYSYKYREANERQNQSNSIKDNLGKSKSDRDVTKKSEDEDWI